MSTPVQKTSFVDAERLQFIRKEVATMVAKPEQHSLVDRLVEVVAREIKHTHSMHMAYADYVTDRMKAAEDVADKHGLGKGGRA